MANQASQQKVEYGGALSSANSSRADSKAKNGFISRDGNLTLKEWLQVSWFYPEGFEKKFIQETLGSYLVFGETQVLKIFKAPELGADDFKAKWFTACDDLLDNYSLCGEVYLSILLLRYEDGEPTWEARSVSREVNRYIAPEADEVALLMRRVPDRSLLANQLNRSKSSVNAKLEDLASSLSRFHNHQKIEFASQEVAIDSALLLASSERQIRKFCIEFSSYLDPYSQIALEQAASFVSSFLRNKRDVLEKRIMEGYYIDGHGALSCENVYFRKRLNHSRSGAKSYDTGFFARASRTVSGRVSDVLNDVASLVVDLQARGFNQQAKKLEEAYFLRQSLSFDRDVYKFFLVMQSLLQAQKYIQLHSNRSIEIATNCISMAFRRIVEVDDGFALVVVGASEFSETVAGALAALLGVKIVNEEDIDLRLPEQVHFERIVKRSQIEQEKSGGLVLRLPTLSRDQEYWLSRELLEDSSRYALLHCDSNTVSKTENIWQDLRDCYCPKLCSYPISDMASPPDLAFSIVRQMAHGGKSDMLSVG